MFEIEAALRKLGNGYSGGHKRGHDIGGYRRSFGLDQVTPLSHTVIEISSNGANAGHGGDSPANSLLRSGC